MTKIAKALDRRTLLEEDLRNLNDEGCEGNHERGYWDECSVGEVISVPR